jgi:hypothetical protein
LETSGKGVVLDVDPNLIPSTIEAYVLRPFSRKTFESFMKVLNMINKGEEKERVLRACNRFLRKHVRSPVASYDEIYSPIVSIGPLYQQNLIDISPSQRNLREKLEAQVMMMQRKRMSYVS